MKPDQWQTEEFTFYGAGGERLGVYTLQESGQGWPPTVWFVPARKSVWFAGKLIWEDGATSGSPVYGNRLGSNRAIGGYYPYGEEISSTANDRTKFGTYNRDGFTGLDYADQRFYASSYGRFNTPDPYDGSAKSSNPSSWNRFAYVGGDPVNLLDPRGLEQQDCSDAWIGDASVSGPCCLPGAYWSDPSDEAACYTGDQGGTTSAPTPKCWQNRTNINATLNNLGSDVVADVTSQFSSTDLQLLKTDISIDSASELALISGAVPPGSPAYVGGHFNLNLTAAQIGQFSALDQQAFASEFAPNGSGDGVRQAASTGLAATSGYWLHSQIGKNDPGIAAGTYSFHFDRFSGTSFPLGTLGHFGYDVVGGHLGHPCLDPAWRH